MRKATEIDSHASAGGAAERSHGAEPRGGGSERGRQGGVWTTRTHLHGLCDREAHVGHLVRRQHSQCGEEALEVGREAIALQEYGSKDFNGEAERHAVYVPRLDELQERVDDVRRGPLHAELRS